MTRWRAIFILNLFLLAMLILVVRAALLTVGDESTTRANLATISRSPATYTRLSKHMTDLESLTTNIEKHNLGEIRDAVNRTVVLVRQASAEFKAQQDSWEKIQTLIRRDQISFRDLRQQLDEVQKLQSGEVARLKRALDEVTKPSVIADVINLSLSFFLGFISSIAASHAYSLWQARRNRKRPLA